MLPDILVRCFVYCCDKSYSLRRYRDGQDIEGILEESGKEQEGMARGRTGLALHKGGMTACCILTG